MRKSRIGYRRENESTMRVGVGEKHIRAAVLQDTISITVADLRI